MTYRALFYTVLLFSNLVSPIFATYEVTVTDPTLVNSPRMYGASSVVFNNSMYVYGGKTGLNFDSSNKMYKYSLSNDSSQIFLTSVNQSNQGPNCSYCGAVMINSHQMMILTNPDTNSDDVVKPYIFDFTNNTWMSNDTLPYYNESQKDEFLTRDGHSTAITNDALRVYTIMGMQSGIKMTTAWYFDIQNYSYNIVEGVPNTEHCLSSNAINLLDGNIGVVFGAFSSGNLSQYSSVSQMGIINVAENTWENRTLGGKVLPQRRRGASYAVSLNNTRHVYFFGGQYAQNGTISILRHLDILDLETYSWLSVNVSYEKGSAVDTRYFTVAAVLNNNTFITALGTLQSDISREKRDVDIFMLPDSLNNNSSIIEEPINITWKSSFISTSVDVTTKNVLIAFCIIFVVSSVLFVIVIVIIVKAAEIKRDPEKQQRFAQLNWGNKIADLVLVKNVGFITTVLIISLLSACVAYFAYNIIHSPISTSEDSFYVESITVPDIRVCYSGWEDNDPPELKCQYDSPTDIGKIDCSDFLVKLDNSIHTPTLAGRFSTPTCYLFLSTNESVVYSYQPIIQLYHMGRTYTDSEAVFVQFYEPTKNPIRRLYNFTSFPVMNVNEMDQWLDTELYSGEQSDVADKVFVAYPDSAVSVQFDTVYTLQQNVSKWNYVGIFPAKTNASSLSITHSDVIARARGENRNTTDTFLGSINISPSNFMVKTITESRDYSLLSSLGSLGGLIGVATGAYVLLFGTKPGDPWGWMQRVTWAKKRQMRKLVNYFDITEIRDIPFVTPVHRRFSTIFNKNNRKEEEPLQELLIIGEGSDLNKHNISNETITASSEMDDIKERLGQLEARNQVLELILRSYYISDEIFNELKIARTSQ